MVRAKREPHHRLARQLGEEEKTKKVKSESPEKLGFDE
jgi:hypothetical protein